MRGDEGEADAAWLRFRSGLHVGMVNSRTGGGVLDTLARSAQHPGHWRVASAHRVLDAGA
eukprot:4416411-Prymnesium_polylepis.1